MAEDDGVIDLTEDEALVLDVLGNDADPDGDTLMITEVGGQPIALGGSVTLSSGSVGALNTDGTLEYDPADNLNGPDSFTYTIVDTDGATDTAQIDVNILPVNDVPVTDADLPDQADLDGETITPVDVSGSFSDIDGDPLTFTAAGLPPGLSIDPVTGVVSGTLDIDASASGPYTVVITATDQSGDSVSTDFEWNIDNVPPIVSEPIGPQTVTDNQPVNIATGGSFVDPEGDPVVFTAIGLPDGLNIDPVTGVITGTPNGDASVDGPYTVTVTVSDEQGDSVSDTFTLTVINPVPTIANLPPASVIVGEPFTLNIGELTTDPDGDTMTFVAAGLPEGLTIDPANGVVSGVPAVPSNDPYIIEITVSDGQGGVATQIFELTVTADPFVPEVSRSEILPLGVDVIGGGKAIDSFADDRLDALYGEGVSDDAPLDLRSIFEERDRNQSLRDALDVFDHHLRGGMAVATNIPGLGDNATINVEGIANDNSVFVGLSETISAMTDTNVTRWSVDISGRPLPDWIDYQAGSDFLILNRPLSEETITLRIQAVLDNGRRVGGNFEINLRTGAVELVGNMQAQSLTLSEQFVQLADAERSKDNALLDALSA